MIVTFCNLCSLKINHTKTQRTKKIHVTHWILPSSHCFRSPQLQILTLLCHNFKRKVHLKYFCLYREAKITTDFLLPFCRELKQQFFQPLLPPLLLFVSSSLPAVLTNLKRLGQKSNLRYRERHKKPVVTLLYTDFLLTAYIKSREATNRHRTGDPA